MKKNQMIGLGLAVVVLLLLGSWWVFGRESDAEVAQVEPTPVPEPVNVIPVAERPYVSLQPLNSRNELEFVVHDLKIEAGEVEVTLEYDRNEGVLDAVLRTFFIDEIPVVEKMFMGSKSAGGHVTYHDDVIGGTLHLEFDGDDPYALENPWRYSDTETEHTGIGTADGKFQVEFNQPWRMNKYVVMQSPGYPDGLTGEVVAGPYLFRGVGTLPSQEVTVKMRLDAPEASMRMLGFDGEEWVEIESSLDGKTLTAETEVYQVYVVVL